MAKSEQPEELLSLNRLSRQLDIPYSRALQLYITGALRPDFIADRNFFFLPKRLPKLKVTVDDALGTTQYFDEVDGVMKRRLAK